MHLFKSFKTIAFALVLMTSAFYFANTSVHAAVNMKPAYDLSEYQQSFSDNQVKALKNETSFVILKAQNGSARKDPVFAHNSALMEKYGVAYGVYSYSCYTSVSDAANEASSLHQTAPHADFYVNDCEENDMKSGNIDDATSNWATTMKKYTSRPVVLYSGLDFMTRNLVNSKNQYSALWIASYGAGEPNPSYKYDLWQYTDHQKSQALGQSVDASIIPTGGKPLSFWIGTQGHKTVVRKASKSKTVHTKMASEKSAQSMKTVTVISKQGVQIKDENHHVLRTMPYHSQFKLQSTHYVNHQLVGVTEHGGYCALDKSTVTIK